MSRDLNGASGGAPGRGHAAPPIEFELNGRPVEVADDGCSLLEALRDRLGVRSPKDGCSPQGQCGCCTVWVDGSARVACVTPAKRIAGRQVTTVEGLADADRWAESFCAAGASQCGFCTPGVIMRLAALAPDARADPDAVRKALLANVCRCTGWNSIVEATVGQAVGRPARGVPGERDLEAAARRAGIEGRSTQLVDRSVALGRGGFADDLAPPDALVAVLDQDGDWVVAETLADARRRARKVQGRRTTAPPSWPIEPPPGEWARTLCTTWTEPAYLEPDASWCAPGGEPASPLGNGGAFGGKLASDVGAVARRLADSHQRPVRVLLTREDTVRLGPKRPPLAIALAADGTGLARIARPARAGDEELLRASVAAVAPGLTVEFVDIAGCPVSSDLRAAGWAEAAAAVASLADGPDRVVAPNGAAASAAIGDDGAVEVRVRCGRPLDPVVLRSYCAGAAHMALGMVRSEALVVAADGAPLDLTIRSFGVLRAIDTPRIDVVLEPDERAPVNGSDAVFAAVLAAAWRHAGHPARLPDRA